MIRFQSLAVIRGSVLGLTVALIALAGCSSTVGESPPEPKATAPVTETSAISKWNLPELIIGPPTVTVAAGTSLPVRAQETISTESHENGDEFQAVLDETVRVDEMVAIPKGSAVVGRVASSKKAGRVKGLASLGLRLDRIETPDGRTVDIQTGTLHFQAKSTKKKDAAKVAAGAGIGAAIGAIAGGGKGAAIGAAAGGGAGTGTVLATRGKHAVVANEARLNFTMEEAVEVEIDS